MNPLKKVLDLAKKTNDKMIILDNEGNPECVIMSFEQYENMNGDKMGVRDLTEGELLAKINCDIATWKEVQSDSENSEICEDLAENIWLKHDSEEISLNLDKIEVENTDLDDNEQYYFEPVE